MLFLMNNASSSRPSKASFVVLWEVVQSTVSHSIEWHEGGTWTVTVTWNTTAKGDQGDELVLTRTSDQFQVTVTGTPTDPNGLSHSLSHTRTCVVNEQWNYVVKSKRLKYTTGTVLSLSTSMAKTFKIKVCLD